jgi:hypothetical protein
MPNLGLKISFAISITALWLFTGSQCIIGRCTNDLLAGHGQNIVTMSLTDCSNEVNIAWAALSNAVRELTPVGYKPIPPNPVRMNLLARSHTFRCRICNYPGHQCDNIANSTACRTAITSTIGFWEDMAVHISNLYSTHDAFNFAIRANEPTYAMRLDNSPLKGIKFEDIFVDRLTRNYLKFQSHFAGIKPKAMKILQQEDLEQYEAVTKTLNDFLLKGQSCNWITPWQTLLVLISAIVSDLFENSIVNGELTS